MTSCFSNEEPLKIAVLGAGAVGCYYGGLLARAGHRVTLIGRADHVSAIQRDGLRLETRSFDDQIRVEASTDVSAVREAALILFCVKSTDTVNAGLQIAPFLSPSTAVVCLQNGVDNAERLRTVLPEQSISSAVVYVATEMAGLGHVRHHGRGDLLIEDQWLGSRLAIALESAGIPINTSANVRGALWFKLILNCAYNAISAISQQPYGKMISSVGVTEVMNDVVNECLLVAQADGVTIPGDIQAGIRMIVESMPSQLSSTAQDLARGKASEIDHLNGFVVSRGAHWGIATPANRVLWALIKLLEMRADD